MANDDSLWTKAERDGWRVELLTAGDTLEVVTDVHVYAPDGRHWAGTVASVEAIEAVMDWYRESGEALGGRYFWAADLLIVRVPTVSVAFDSVFDLIAIGELDACFDRAPDTTSG